MKKYFQCTRCLKTYVCSTRSTLPKNPQTGEIGRCADCGNDQFVLFFADPRQETIYNRPEVTIDATR